VLVEDAAEEYCMRQELSLACSPWHTAGLCRDMSIQELAREQRTGVAYVLKLQLAPQHY
jgi:hypothetical protein